MTTNTQMAIRQIIKARATAVTDKRANLGRAHLYIIY
jgi:hypothetical protein